jgi:DNA recombination protein RmuC
MNTLDLSAPLIVLGDRPVSLGLAVGVAAAAVALLLLLAALSVARAARERARAEAEAEAATGALEARVAELLRAQSETSGRLKAMTEIIGERQADLTRALSERLDGMGHRIGQSMADTTRSTHESLTKLAERLVKIDEARETITRLSGHVVALEKIFSDKQTRGAFGQGRMEAIVADALPAGAYAFQATLTNGTRPDCLVKLPNGQPGLVVDAKFPLEAWNRINGAATPEALKAAETQFRRDVTKHVDDIRARYFVPGETQDTAFLFVPSESVFAEIHERFDDVVAKAAASRVVFVSPSLLLLSIQLVQAILRDERMREQAHVIQVEVRKLVEDVDRLNDRVLNLQRHFGQAVNDVEQIVVSSTKIQRRGARLEALEVDDADGAPAPLVRAAGGTAA